MECVAIRIENHEKELFDSLLKKYGVIHAEFFKNFGPVTSYIRQNIVDVVFLSIDEHKGAWVNEFEQIKRADNGTRIILVGSNRSDAVKAFELDADDFLLEPVSESRLEKSINRIFAS